MKKLGTNKVTLIASITLALLMAGCGSGDNNNFDSSGRDNDQGGSEVADVVFTDPNAGDDDDNMGDGNALPVSCDDLPDGTPDLLISACCSTINMGTVCQDAPALPANCDALGDDPTGALLAACCATVNMGDACADMGGDGGTPSGACDILPEAFQAQCCAMGGTGNVCMMQAAGESVQSRSANVSAMLTGAVIGGDKLVKTAPKYDDLALPLADVADSIESGTLFDALNAAIETLEADGEISAENATAAFTHLADAFTQFADDQTTAADVRAAANLIAAVLTALATDPANRAESLADVSSAIAVALAGPDLELLQELALRSLGTQF